MDKDNIDTNYTLDDLRKDKIIHNSMFKKIKGCSYYSFTSDKIYHLLDNNLLESVFPKREADVRMKREISLLYADSSTLHTDYDILPYYSDCFRVKDGKNFFAIIITLDDIERIGELLLDNKNIIIPSLYNCDYCDYHSNNKSYYTNHLKSKKCRLARGLEVEENKPKTKETYQCKECNSPVWDFKSHYDRHRKTSKCKRNRGIEVVGKAKKTYQCNLCDTRIWTDKSHYDRHRKTKKCQQKQKETNEI